MRSSFCGTCASLSLRASAGSRTLATDATHPRRTPLSSSMRPPPGASEPWQREPTTLAWTARTWGSRLRNAAGEWRPRPLQTGLRSS
eukprot:14081349-Alexandrium_andersonii.AAC.1